MGSTTAGCSLLKTMTLIVCEGLCWLLLRQLCQGSQLPSRSSRSSDQQAVRFEHKCPCREQPCLFLMS
uniref:Secreted protein n=1 Tax=Caenorhabditis japonica TaxID=281687 RepID=A0A8R1IQA0_CAEJA